jgi:multidrug efflux pump subunit AcrA (membrane-fusion protein)
LDVVIKLKKNHSAWLVLLAGIILTALSGCKSTTEEGDTEDEHHTVTPVTITHPQIGPLSSYIELNATSTFLKKDIIRANAAGYITEVKIAIGQQVKKGDVMFVLQTKESRALSDFKSTLDSTLKFNGYISIRSTKDGVVNAINHQRGDYVQDADQLAIISEPGSLVFIIDAPFEMHQYLNNNKNVTILLPDSSKYQGSVSSSLSAMDVSSQTQNYIVTPQGVPAIPEGLIARIRITKTVKDKAVTLPKSAVLTDEKQQEFWIMKLINDTTAVKVPVSKGIEAAGKVEILSPPLSPADRIIASGNYGLADTANVNIAK